MLLDVSLKSCRQTPGGTDYLCLLSGNLDKMLCDSTDVGSCEREMMKRLRVVLCFH